ncbi:MAG: peptide chain release factor 3 [Elusimicrobia bacterium GWC2_51_8]|nr:MAG: peptide chain release factor 3 [Elusimicrobia bacterium GWA2_51_34]OGR65212.1 MAG: peptide chain release factor 3 [Elusimicrobia bacterium GWC2_51_8]OGR84529.1 MAG: peptide chain release factor 3 [Elusimicrobia bacterium GWF2_52_66]HAF96408.1 peptide chain release factor 3 [Elusimicrobiota bacterium]HCE98325.1 peptide chain release factor 3 [Elusimicrobiota bacterium]
MTTNSQISRRRTFAIISHPDAGKTTLTEKLLLYGGAVQLAGSVTARRNQQNTTSDWMELEKKRGISISSTVLQFEYRDFYINLLDTPGHRDFSEDTYRVLMAVDAAIMVLDAGKGIESQTLKLFEICRLRQIPIFTFINKLDRPSKESLELLDEIEQSLQLHAFPVNLPLGCGQDFKGVFDRRLKQVHFFERVPGGAFRAPVTVMDCFNEEVLARLDTITRKRVMEEISVLDQAGEPFDAKVVLAGDMTPVFFGSAANNFGVQMLLDGFLELSPPPRPQNTLSGNIPPEDPRFSGFIFKIQSNMDPKHRDQIAFLRVCSGVFQRDMKVLHSRSGKTVRLSSSHKLFGRSRETVNEAYPGDVIGIVGHSEFSIGDTLSDDASIVYKEVPRFPPEHFAFLHCSNTIQFKKFRAGLEHLLQEGVVQVFSLGDGAQRIPLLGAVGPLQFEVLQHRLQFEYGAETRLEATPWSVARWVVKTPPETLNEASLPSGSRRALDVKGNTVLLFPKDWECAYFLKNNPKITLSKLPPEIILPQA